MALGATCTPRRWRWPVLDLSVLSACAPAMAGDTTSRHALTQDMLLHGHAREVDLAAYAPPADAQAPTRVFEGTLRVSGTPKTRTIHADPAFLSRRQIAAARTFPDDFDYQFVQDRDVLLPVRRGYIVTDHPYWDFVLLPGRAWNEPGDHGLTRAALPFELVQKNMNCTHYGVMTFLFGDDGTVSQAALQVSSETCRYLKFDMWGLFKAHYSPHPVAGREAVIAAWREHHSRRLPQKPIAELAADHPGVDPGKLAIGPDNARTLYGLVVGGVNYVSGCPTRRGEYPFCDELAFPSYSTAKSAEAALALMAMQQRHPGLDTTPVHVFAPLPGCRASSWEGVTLRNLIDMTTGHYDSPRYMADEDARKAGDFFNATSARKKSIFSCRAYKRRAPPGTTWVYHTSDTFLLGEELAGHLRSRTGNAGADVFTDVVDARIYKPLHLSATAQVTRRTADAAAQPFFGYGLQFTRDDIARLALFIGRDHGRIDGKQVLDPKLLDLALQRAADQRGSVVTSFPDFRYQLGFWARDVAHAAGCSQPAWVPFMSGFGAISVVLYPGGIVYYSVSDSGDPSAFDWSPSAKLVRKIDNFCR